MHTKDPLSYRWCVILWIIRVVSAPVTEYFSFCEFSHLYDKLPLALNVMGFIALVGVTVMIASDLWESFNDLHVRDPKKKNILSKFSFSFIAFAEDLHTCPG